MRVAKRFFLALLLVVIMGASLTGCASDSSNLEELSKEFGDKATITQLPDSTIKYLVHDSQHNLWYVQMDGLFTGIYRRVKLFNTNMQE